MNQIFKATIDDKETLTKLSVEAFLPAHSHSASRKDIEEYLAKNFSLENFQKELLNTTFEYYLIEYEKKIVGFSKVIFNLPNENIESQNITKMERLYLLKEFYGLNLGVELLKFNIELAKQNNQQGTWLEVWIENKRAIKFYTKMGFKIIGSALFKVTETHYNPNYIMYFPF